MRIVFMGTPEFAVPSLRAIIGAGYDIAAVVTNPDEPQGRGLKIMPPAVKVVANELGIKLYQVASLKDPGFLQTLKEISPDLMVVVAFRILPKEVFTIPKLGTFNLHASLLPRYRGAAPINWAIVNGERETGVTTFFLDEKVDTGKIILQKKLEIGENETAGELSERLSELGAEAVVETTGIIRSGNIELKEQDPALASRAPKISKEDCLIDWSKSSKDVHNFIRGFSPEPAAYSFLNGKMIRIFRTVSLPPQASSNPGALTIEKNGMMVSCGSGCVQIEELQMEGKKRMSASEFVRGARIAPGTKFEASRG